MRIGSRKREGRDGQRERERGLNSFFFLCLGALNLNLDGIFLDSNEFHAANIWLSDRKSTRVLTATSSSAFRWLTWTKTARFSSTEPWTGLWNDTFNHSIYIWHSDREKRYGFKILPSLQPPPSRVISIKYDHLPAAPPSTPSPFSPLKSAGHMCLIRNDKCCSLAVPLQNSHLSWQRTFYSCQLFDLTLTQPPQKNHSGGGASEVAHVWHYSEAHWLN